MEQLYNYFKNKTVLTALDVGTGTGDFLVHIKHFAPDAKITGVDPSQESLTEASREYPEISFMEMTGEKLLFPNNYFYVVSISMALHHLPDVKATLKEMQRVLKPGGWIVVNELFSDNLNPAQEVHKLYHHFRSSIDRLLGVSHNPTFKKNEIREMIIDSGIDVLLEFEYGNAKNVIKSTKDIQERVDKMEVMLNQIKNRKEYSVLKPQINTFKQKAQKYGFEMATRVVIVGSPN